MFQPKTLQNSERFGETCVCCNALQQKEVPRAVKHAHVPDRIMKHMHVSDQRIGEISDFWDRNTDLFQPRAKNPDGVGIFGLKTVKKR
jgi:hypothetical protein